MDFTAVNIQYQNVTLKWTKPVSKGIPITSYLIKYNQQGKEEKFETTINEIAEGQTEPATGIIQFVKRILWKKPFG